MKLTFPSYERQNQWLRDYVCPIVCDLDFKKAAQNYRNNRRTEAPLEDIAAFPGGCKTFKEFADLAARNMSAVICLHPEAMEHRILKITREWLPRHPAQEASNSLYMRMYNAVIGDMLSEYALEVPPEKRLPQLRELAKCVGEERRRICRTNYGI